jgi:hypothetical protein
MAVVNFQTTSRISGSSRGAATTPSTRPTKHKLGVNYIIYGLD